MKCYITTLLVIFGLFPQLQYAQDTIPHRRPKVGLVLSGGAAKGIAHIGVLKVLEEAGIVPDYITGTSMGSIIGGLYAIGYSAQDMENLILAQDWDKVLSDRIPLNEVIFEEKPFFENALLDLSLEKWKIKIPSGLIYGQQINNLLTKLTLSAHNIQHFHELPVPFECVGSDIIQGLSVPLRQGYLPDAMRASMAIPTVFTPIVRDSLLLVDGGLVHNFPVSEVKAMGADIIIGVYTGARRADVEKLNSLTGIVTQAVFLLGIQDAEREVHLCDIYIEPDLDFYAAQDFKKADSIIARGERAARAKFAELKALADSINQIGPPPCISALPKMDSLWIDRIEVEGNSEFTGVEISNEFGLKPGKMTTPEHLANCVNNLYGTNYFRTVDYRLKKVGDINALVIKVQEKSPVMLKAAIHYDSYSEAGFLLNMTLRNWLMPSSRFMVTGKVAGNYRLNFSLLKYLGKIKKTALFANLQFNRDKIPIFRNGIRNEEFSLFDTPLDIGIQKRLGKNALIGMGFQREQVRFRPVTGTDIVFDRLSYRNYNVFGFYQLNTLDRNILPTEGTTLSIEFKYLRNNRFEVENLDSPMPISEDSIFAFDPYSKLMLYSKSYIKLHQHASLTLTPFLGITFNPNNTFGDFFLLGAPDALNRRALPFHGLNPNEIVTQSILGAGVGYQHFLKSNLMLSFDVNAAFYTQPNVLRDDFGNADYQSIVGGGVSIGYNSFIGPVKLSFAIPFYAEGDIRDKLRTYIILGHRF
ncbi:MAG: patatin-like phospholipase family protein [Saprospiraceae bacterium]|nr:patatin-like phospholipase family protein [Saprospiraceae bacterium]